jgi:hypothetical protein
MCCKNQTIGLTQIALLFTIAVAAGPVIAFGQQASPGRDPSVQRPSFARAGNIGQQQPIRFGRNAARVGDQIEQKLTLEMRLTTSLRQGNQIVEKNQMTMRCDQHRVVTTTEVADGRAISVMVRYLAATKQMAAGEQPPSGNVPPADSNSMSQSLQPVHGNSYHCKREGGDDGKLHVFDEAGRVPPSDELEIVAQNMETIGRANPLAEFLAGKSVAIGQTLSLPQDAADRLINLEERFGEVNRFELTFRKTLVADGVPCAEFVARIDAASNDSSQMRLQVEGPLVVQIDTCRAVRTELSGPIGLSETRGTYSTISHLFGTGRMNMRIDSIYGVAKH